MTASFHVTNELTGISTNNYSGNKMRNILTADGSAEFNPALWIRAGVLVREIMQDAKLLSPDFLVSTEIKPFTGKQYYVRGSFSKNSKLPTMNDMYWYPGGNPSLKNETGYLSEITVEMINPFHGQISLRNDLTLFSNRMTNMIQWHPGESYYWEADNLAKTNTSGIEAGLGIFYTRPILTASFKGNYTFTKAIHNDNSSADGDMSQNQLVYIPEHQANAVISVRWKNLYSAFGGSLTGKRYIKTDNSQYLPGYVVCDAHIGVTIGKARNLFEATFTVDNIFNLSYQNIAYYPMPGRSFLVSLAFHLKD